MEGLLRALRPLERNPGLRYRDPRLGRGMRRVLGVLLLGVLPSGCGTVQHGIPARTIRPLRPATLDEVLSAYDGYCKRLESLSASGDLDVADLGKGATRKVSVRFVATRGGKLYLKGSVAVVTAFEVVANGETFWFQVPSKKTVWTGAERSNLRAAEGDTAPYYSLRPADLVDAFLPEPLPVEGALLLEGDEETFSLAQGTAVGGRGVVRRRVSLSRETLLPVLLRSYDERGDLLVEVSLSGFASGTPRHAVIFRPVEGYRATFDLSKFEANAEVPERAFAPRIPEGYAVREVPN